MTEPPRGSTEPLEEIHWPSLVAAISSISAVGIAIGLGLPLLSIILEKRGISSSLIGLNSAMAGVAAMIAAPLTTKAAHSLGVARTMVLSVILSAISAMGFYYAYAFWMWFPLRIVFHGATTALFILSEFWINVASPPRKRGLVLGIYATVLSVGFGAGSAIFSALGSEGPLPFVVGAIAILLAAIPLYIARNESPVLNEGPEMHFFRYIFIVPTATAAVFVFGAVEAGGLSMFPVYATRAGFTESQAGNLLTVMAVGNVLFQIPVGMISDKMKDRRLLLVIMGLVGLLGAVLMPWFMYDWRLLSLILLIWGGSIAGLYTVGLSHLGSRLQGADLAAANAAFVFCYAIGTVAGPQVIGSTIDATGNDGFAWAIAFFFGVYVVFGGIRLLFRPKRA